MSNYAEDNDYAHGGAYLPRRGPHHWSRGMALQAIFDRHHRLRKAVKFHRWAMVGGLVLAAVTSSGDHPHDAWTVIGVVIALGCAIRGAIAWNALPGSVRYRLN